MGTKTPEGKDVMYVFLVQLAKAGLLMPGSVLGTKRQNNETIAQEAIWIEVSLCFKNGRAETCQL